MRIPSTFFLAAGAVAFCLPTFSTAFAPNRMAFHRPSAPIRSSLTSRNIDPNGSRSSSRTPTILQSDWSDFAYIDDDEEDLDATSGIDFADENDPQERKAEVGASLEAPELDWFGDPIEVPLGSALPLETETIQGLLAACRTEIGTMFGYSAENRGVGITGGVDFVEFDGPIVVLRLKGRFWHQRATVLDRVAAYLMGRCPEIVDVVVEDEWQLTDEANNEAIHVLMTGEAPSVPVGGPELVSGAPLGIQGGIGWDSSTRLRPVGNGMSMTRPEIEGVQHLAYDNHDFEPMDPSK